MRAGHELTEHTADVGVHAWGATAEAVFEQAALAMVGLMYDPDAVRPVESRTIALTADDRELLLAAWLNELLYLLDAERLLLGRFQVYSVGPQERTGWALRAAATGERHDSSRHTVRAVVKAATLHDLELRATDDGWEGRVLLDV